MCSRSMRHAIWIRRPQWTLWAFLKRFCCDLQACVHRTPPIHRARLSRGPHPSRPEHRGRRRGARLSPAPRASSSARRGCAGCRNACPRCLSSREVNVLQVLCSRRLVHSFCASSAVPIRAQPENGRSAIDYLQHLKRRGTTPHQTQATRRLRSFATTRWHTYFSFGRFHPSPAGGTAA